MALPDWMEHNQNVSASQFNPSSVGPQHAKVMAGLEPMRGRSAPEQRRRQIEGHQEQLFPVGRTDYMLEPHQQTRAQFGADPRTWWHGRYSEALPRTGGQRNAGIHVGTFGSSDARRRSLGPSHKKTKSGDFQEWRSYPVRLTGQVRRPPDTAIGRDEGNVWAPKQGIHYYENAVEDAGSVSALVPNRAGMQTHREAIKAAQAAGKPVHPMIEWESKQLGKDYDPSHRDPHALLAEHGFTSPNLQPHLFNPNFPGNDVFAGKHRQRQLESEARTEINKRKSMKMLSEAGLKDSPDLNDLAAEHARLLTKYAHLVPKKPSNMALEA